MEVWVAISAIFGHLSRTSTAKWRKDKTSSFWLYFNTKIYFFFKWELDKSEKIRGSLVCSPCEKMNFKFKKKKTRLVYKSTLKCDFNESFEVAFALEDKSPSKGRVKTNPNVHTERNLFLKIWTIFERSLFLACFETVINKL